MNFELSISNLNDCWDCINFAILSHVIFRFEWLLWLNDFYIKWFWFCQWVACVFLILTSDIWLGWHLHLSKVFTAREIFWFEWNFNWICQIDMTFAIEWLLRFCIKCFSFEWPFRVEWFEWLLILSCKSQNWVTFKIYWDLQFSDIWNWVISANKYFRFEWLFIA